MVFHGRKVIHGKALGPFPEFHDEFPHAFTRCWRGFEILGVPVGDEAFVTSYIDTEVMKKVQEKIAAIEQIDNLHVRYCLLRSSVAFGPLVHILRGVDPRLTKPGAARLDKAVRRAFARLLGGDDIAERAWTQATLPTSGGGLGFRSAEHHADAAFAGGCHQCSGLDGWSLEEDEAYHSARERLTALLPKPESPAQEIPQSGDGLLSVPPLLIPPLFMPRRGGSHKNAPVSPPDLKRYDMVIFVDGGCTPNPGTIAAAAVVAYKLRDGAVYESTAVTRFVSTRTTNNIMESLALLGGARLAEGRTLLIGDSENRLLQSAALEQVQRPTHKEKLRR